MYPFSQIEKKWSKRWFETKIYEPNLRRAKRPFYNLMMFPYPSAEGLHVGNMYAFTGSDIYGRFRRMQGNDVFQPIGLDGFGIHSENYALKIGTHPMKQAKVSEKRFYDQLRSIGNGFAWEERLETYDPEYYKWTQWIFVQMWKRGLAYRKKASVNWCPSCKTVLADEQVVNGDCERCGTEVVKKDLEQWFFKITKYADRLLKNLDNLPGGKAGIDWSEKVKIAQRNWIGKSESTEINFSIKASDKIITVVTTRADTIFGATFLVLAPEHGLITELAHQIKNYDEVRHYAEKAMKKTDFERGLLAKKKTGVRLKGVLAINPVNGVELPVFVSDFVLISYGTGAIFSVPAHDERDFEFAKLFHLPVISVIERPKREALGPISVQIYDEDLSETATEIKRFGIAREYATPTVRVYEIARKNVDRVIEILERARIGNRKDHELIRRGEDFTLEIKPRAINFLAVYTGDGRHINSGFLNNLRTEAAIKKVDTWLKERGMGKPAVYYHLRDWLISRQRYWGPPIPMIHCPACAKASSGKENAGWYAVPEKDLPVKLPQIKNFRPTGKGEAPLASVKSFYETKCPECGAKARRETDVSDTFLDSAWYFFRYTSVDDKTCPWRPEIAKKWLPVNRYIGGAEHSVLHLLYSRFLTMVFKEMGLINFEEPFTEFRAHGLLISSGAKMSKSKGNVVVPDVYIKKYGADVVRLYLMFLGPYEQGGDWRDAGIIGIVRFLNRVWNLGVKLGTGYKVQSTGRVSPWLHPHIKEITEDIANLKYNTAIAELMTALNKFEKEKQISRKDFETFLLLLAPLAPFITEELWQKLGNKYSIHNQAWPKFNTKYLIQNTITLIVQVNGKVRGQVSVKRGVGETEAKKLALAEEKIKKAIGAGKIKRTIFVKDRLINFVV